MTWMPHPVYRRTSIVGIFFCGSILLIGDSHDINLKYPRPTPKSLLGSVEIVNYSHSVQKFFPGKQHYSSSLLSFVVLSLVVTQLLSGLAFFYLLSRCFVQSLIDNGQLPEDFQQRIIRRFWHKGKSAINSPERAATELQKDKTTEEHQ